MGLPRTSRRDLLRGSAALAVHAALGRSLARAGPGWPDPFDPEDSRGDEVAKIVGWVLTTPRDPALRRAARELRAGLDPTQLLGAILVASARDVAPDRASFNHAALSVSAIDQLAGGAPAEECQRDVLWCLDFFKESQEMDARSEAWRMPPVASARLPEGAKARAALADALERWDPEAADVAVAGWARSATPAEIFAVIWEYGARCSANLGHKGIYAALSRRALPLAGEGFAEDVLRSVVSSFLADGSARNAAPFERSREIAARGIVARARHEASDAGPSRELLGAIRQSAPEEMPAVVAKLLEDGAASAALWDGVVAAAAEVTVADPTVGPLHASTSANSLHYIALHAQSVRVSTIALMQAAAWVAGFRSGLESRKAAFRIDAPAAGPAPGADDPARFLESARVLARKKSDDVHEFKLAAAALEEAHLAGAWARPFVCQALAAHLPPADRADSVRLQRIRDAMEVAAAH